MATLDTTDDLLRAARENPEFLEASRRDVLIEELLVLPERFAAYASTTDKRLESIEGDLGVLKTDMGVLRGVGLETRLADKGLAKIASAFSMRRMRIVRLAEHNRASERFNEAIRSAMDIGLIDNSEHERLLDTDLIVQGTVGIGNIAYCVTEALYTAETDDIDKVANGANILRKVFADAEVYAALYCIEGTPDIEAEGKQKGVTLIRGQLP